jgi:hypothetical protein
MKNLKNTLLLVIALLSLSVLNAQHVKVTEGNLSPLKNEKEINLEFTYDNMRVGKYDKDEDYIAAKREEYNKKESGRGDTWAKSWVSDREYRFKPKFTELFEKNSEMTTKKEAKYTLIVHTTFTEPGFNVGVWKKSAEIDAEIIIVETANRGNVVAKLVVNKAPGRTFWGGDFDTGERLSEAYAVAGKVVGKYIRSKS